MGERECLRCGHCCMRMDLNMIPPEDILDFLEAHYGRAIDKIWLQVKHECKQLEQVAPGKYKCKIYKKRPQLCRLHECDYMKGSDIGRFVQFVISDENSI